MCLRRFEKACALGEPIVSFKSGRPELHNKWYVPSSLMTLFFYYVVFNLVFIYLF
uniref:Uncharacterized protein n=1 Tax=Rhizophora mucronata TaxID=61149 RepID=A0A2P2LSH2_RHIMU